MSCGSYFVELVLYIRGYIDMLLVSVVRNNTCFRQPHGMVCCRARGVEINSMAIV